MVKAFLRLYCPRISVVDSHSFVVGTDLTGLSDYLGYFDIEYDETTLADIRKRFEEQKVNGMIRRSSYYQEALEAMNKIPNYHGRPEYQRRLFRFAVDPDLLLETEKEDEGVEKEEEGVQRPSDYNDGMSAVWGEGAEPRACAAPRGKRRVHDISPAIKIIPAKSERSTIVTQEFPVVNGNYVIVIIPMFLIDRTGKLNIHDSQEAEALREEQGQGQTQSDDGSEASGVYNENSQVTGMGPGSYMEGGGSVDDHHGGAYADATEAQLASAATSVYGSMYKEPTFAMADEHEIED